MWIFLAFLSACLLGFYDVFKKQSLQGNAVLPVLMINTSVCALFFLPLIVSSACGMSMVVPCGGWHEHALVLVKAVIVLSSWVCGYLLCDEAFTLDYCRSYKCYSTSNDARRRFAHIW